MADGSYFLLAATFLPLLLAPVSYVIGRRSGVNATTWFSFGVLAVSTGLLLIPSMLLYGGQQIYSESYSWGYFGNFGLRLDGLSLPFALTIYILCAVIAVYSKPYMVRKIMGDRISEEDHGLAPAEALSGYGSGSSSTGISNIESGSQTTVLESQRYLNNQSGLYFALYLAFSMGMLGTVLATNLIEFYVFFELMLVPSFFLVAIYGYGARRRVALMFFFWTHVGAVVLLLGLLAMGFFAGGFDYSTIKENAAKIPQTWIPIIVFAIVIGLGVKLAAFILHIWLPYAHAEAPTPISALLSPAMIGIGGYIIIRMFTLLLPEAFPEIGLGIAIWGVLTMFYGGIMALAQDDIKRLFAYSSVSQMGYIIFGIGTTTQHGIEGAVFQFVSHGTAKGILFMVAGIIIVQAGGLRSIKGMGGLSQRLPITATCAMIGFLGLMGFPETNGFQSEWLIFSGGLQQGSSGAGPLSNYWLLVSILAVISTIVTAAYSLWTMKRVFFGRLPESLSQVKEGSWYMLAPVIFLTAVTILLGVLPGLIDNYLVPTASTLTPPLLP